MFILKTQTLAVFFVLCIFSGIFGQQKAPDPVQNPHLAKILTYGVGDRVSNFSKVTTNASDLSLYNFIGKKVIVLNFFVTW